MARIRTIKPEFWQSEKLAGLSEHARLLAIALLNHADDEGYFMANVALVRASCFPFDDDSRKTIGSLQELSAIGYIAIMDASGKAIGRVTNFLEHQRIDKPAVSKLKTLFDRGSLLETQPKINVVGEFQEASGNNPGRLQEDSRLEQGTGKGTGKGKEQGSICSEPKNPASEPKEPDEPKSEEPEPPFDPESCEFPVFPCSGDVKTWEATERQIKRWAEAYPAVEPNAAMRRAHAWIMANLSRRKTAKGMKRFVNAWLAKEQDRPAVATGFNNRSPTKDRNGEDFIFIPKART